MVKFINKLLFNVETEGNEETGKFTSKVMSGVSIFAKDNNGDIKERNKINVLTINSDDKKLDKGSSYIKFVEKDANNGKTYYNALAVTKGKAITKDIKGDHIYCLAIPFNGTIDQIVLPSKGVEVYVGAILLSRSFSIPYENRKYSRIIYLVLTVDPALYTEKEFALDFVSHSQFCKKNNAGVYEAVEGKVNEDRIQVCLHNDSRKVKCYHDITNGNYNDIKLEAEGKKVFTVINSDEAASHAEITKKLIEE